ncbi:MAG TPA: hypothetical protein VFD82_09060 [Planctomycetota bacterium]|nr:hypothetical protein [Planctomycetota bacterium]
MWLGDAEYEAAYATYAEPYDTTPFTVKVVATKFKGYPSSDVVYSHLGADQPVLLNPLRQQLRELLVQSLFRAWIDTAFADSVVRLPQDAARTRGR